MIYSLTTAVKQDRTIPQYPIYRLSIAQYHAMIDAGILVADDPVELVEGWLILKEPKIPQLTYTTNVTRENLAAQLPAGWFVGKYDPITMFDSEPEPDIAIIRGKIRDYLHRHPGPADIGLVIEVAHASLAYDQTVKKRLYAAAKIPVYWIINLVNNQVEVYTEPTGTGRNATNQQEQIYGVNDEVRVVIDGRSLATIPAKEILP